MQYPTGYTVSFMVVPSVRAWGFRLGILILTCTIYILAPNISNLLYIISFGQRMNKYTNAIPLCGFRVIDIIYRSKTARKRTAVQRS